LADGYEGAILRSPDAKYKNKRATMGDQALMKLKQFKDAEGIMVDCYPLLPSNTAGKTILKNNVMSREEMLALTEETQGAAGYVVKDIKSQTEFHLSAPPMSLDERRLLWKNRGKLKGKIIKYKFFPYGSDPEKMVPRHATMIGFREDFDLPTELKGMAKKFKLIKPDAPKTNFA
ncbi:MAG: hypothetical protein K2X66_04945, partial [Cyanobacteria bacterium]|nr:hypothetical protein [Cyanobacteriota bacterium]